MALLGSLSDFGIAEILQLIGTQQKTGILHVEGEGETVEIQVFFRSGKVIRCDTSRRDKRDEIGQMLLAAEVIDKAQLDEAMREQKKSLRRVSDIVLESGAVSEEVLAEFVDLQIRETLYRLFEWKKGKYRFESKPPNFAKALVTPLGSEAILMEGVRILDEWPLVRQRISNYETVYTKIREFEAPESDSEALERILDDAFSEFVDAPSQEARSKRKAAVDAAPDLGRNERRVLGLVDGRRDVHALIGLSRVGEFETCKALANLLGDGYIAPVKAKPPLEMPGAAARGRTFKLVGQIAMNALLLGALAAGILAMPRSRAEIREQAGEMAREAASRLRANRILAIDAALRVYRLEHGEFPEQLDSLADESLASEEMLDPPGPEPFDYLSLGSDYDLR